ncbi:MAG: cytochrome c biogenesis protein CcmE [Gemmatimonadetes bacterium]|nr:MAG: cytochrome c biogenesis protein CcmE [Gemmatimonadota bacterium]PYP30450.1 MAG: cytochrome c biogenesis protein CcmE [Gemmatimonadota bacterium]
MLLSGRRAGIALGGGIVALVFAYLVWGGIGNNLVYFLTPTELLAKGPAAYGASIRLGGIVQPGTVHWDADRHELRFRLADTNDHNVEVVSTGVPPEMFTEGIGAVVEGVWTPDGVFHCHNLMIKHSNEYRPPPPGAKPAEYYRQLFRKQLS